MGQIEKFANSRSNLGVVLWKELNRYILITQCPLKKCEKLILKSSKSWASAFKVMKGRMSICKVTCFS